MPVWTDPIVLGEQIRRARRLAGWSQQQLADEVGTSRSKVARWEAGETSSLGESESARRATAIVVGHLTDQLHLMGLVEEPAGLAERVEVLEDELKKLRDRAAHTVHLDDLGAEDEPVSDPVEAAARAAEAAAAAARADRQADPQSTRADEPPDDRATAQQLGGG